MVSIMSKELLVKQMLRLVLCECAFRTWCMSNFFFLMNIFDFDAKLSIGPFSAVYHKTISSAKTNTRANWKKGIYLAQSMRTQSKTD